MDSSVRMFVVSRDDMELRRKTYLVSFFTGDGRPAWSHSRDGALLYDRTAADRDLVVGSYPGTFDNVFVEPA